MRTTLLLILTIVYTCTCGAQDSKKAIDSCYTTVLNGVIYIIEPCGGLNTRERKPPYQSIYSIQTATYTLTKSDRDKLPYTDVRDIISLLPGVYQQRRGDNVSICGARMDGTTYLLDGMVIR